MCQSRSAGRAAGGGKIIILGASRPLEEPARAIGYKSLDERKLRRSDVSEAENEKEKGAERRKGKGPKESGSPAMRELRTARRLIAGATDGEVPPQATAAIGIANVLALLELAAAIRQHAGDSD
jgi:hypothetical protein